jgi:LAGLIDADG-like domain
MQKSDASWLAGLFDGEGSIVFPRKTNTLNSVRIQITNTNHELLERVIAVTGTGTLVSQMHPGSKNWKPHYKPSWAWQCYGENTRSLLRQMLPWLIEKRDKALIVLGE